ncbi:zinc finger protein 574 [Aplysia californica]|uniref:Zinc finger protein 574 n=1 Tax=Aplysia californica TaxID=6500 RepID=A0ABM0JP49_APLCA|nr:zinc finger protein 574 [Aplysia californica]
MEVMPGGTTTRGWVKDMRTARDRHEQNVHLVRDGDRVLVRTMKHIQAGEALCLWYSDELALEVGVPILTPSNIRGYQDYECTHCRAVFRHPNTLKSHMMHRCLTSTVVLTQPSTPLVPFQLLLQTISRPAPESLASDAASHSGPLPAHDTQPQRTKSAGLLTNATKRAANDSEAEEEYSHKSAFKAPSSRLQQKDSVSDEGLMTPDSSTDKQAAVLNLSLRNGLMNAAGMSVPNSNGYVQHWGAMAAQQNAFLARRFHVPYNYNPHVQPYFPLQPHFHNFGLQFLQYARPPQPRCEVSSLGPLLETANCNDVMPLLPTPRESKSEVVPQRAPRPCPPPSLSPSTRQTRSVNPYGINLPSDKEPLDLLPQAYFANKSKRGHLCLYCGKLYSRKYGLKIHMRTHNGYKPLKCKICSRPFGDPSNLNKHVRLHAQGDTPYRCDYCGKVLVRRRDLERHVKSRHPMGNLQTADDLARRQEGEEGGEEEEEELSLDSSSVSVDSHEEDEESVNITEPITP